MVVTAGALDGRAGESLHDGCDHVVAVEVTTDLTVNRILPNVTQGTLVPRAGRDEAERHRGLRIARKQHVTGDLFLHKAGVGFVDVEGGDQVIAIGPGIGPDAVLVVPVGFGEVRRVHPMSRPALAVPRRGQQPVHNPLVGDRRVVRQERAHFLRRRRQADEVEVNPAQQGALVRFRRRLESVTAQGGADKGVDRVPRCGMGGE